MVPDTTTDATPARRRQLILNHASPLTIVAWRDDLIEGHPDSIATASDELLLWWTPILGPTATLMAHRMATLTRGGQSHRFTVEEWANTFGLGKSASRLNATLERLDHFGVIRTAQNIIAVRLAMAPMSLRQLARLPDYLGQAHTRRG